MANGQENKQVDEKLRKQYEEIAAMMESEGLGYALTPGGYIRPEMTDDPELKEAIKQAIIHLEKIEKIMAPYQF